MVVVVGYVVVILDFGWYGWYMECWEVCGDVIIIVYKIILIINVVVIIIVYKIIFVKIMIEE